MWTLDFWLGVVFLALVPFWMAAYGAYVAAETIPDERHRRNVRLQFWGIGLLGLAVAIAYQYRMTKTDEVKQKALSYWQGGITDRLDKIIKQPVSPEQKQAAVNLKNELMQPLPKPTPGLPTAKRYHFSFDSSPGWTEQLKDSIEIDFNGFCAYLADLGFEIPEKFPPFKLTRLFNSGGDPPVQFFYVPRAWAVRDVDLESIILDTRIVADRDLGLSRAALADYIFSFHLKTNDLKLGDRQFRERTVPIFATYFNRSYSKRKLGTYWSDPSPSLINWTDALWEMQAKLGKPYTDRVLYYSIKALDSTDWGAISNTDFDVCLFDFGMFTGEKQQGLQHINETVEILHGHGINVWTYQPKPPEIKQQ